MIMNKKVTILVASHKPDTVFENDVYTPIHVLYSTKLRL